MVPAAIPPLLLFSFVCSITPGPNNLMLASAGSQAGFKRTLPQILGVAAGGAPLFLVAAFGIGAIVTSEPGARLALSLFGASYLGFLALRLWRSGSLPPSSSVRRISFSQAAAFQLANPKAWMSCVPAVATFSDPRADPLHEGLTIYLLFEAVLLPCVAFWAAMGAAARRLLEQRRRLIAFNRAMAVLTALSGLMLLW